MAGTPQHATLVASTVTTFTFDSAFTAVEVLNVNGAAEVYFTTNGATPTIGGIGSDVLPACIGSLVVQPSAAGNTVVKLISAGTPKVSARQA